MRIPAVAGQFYPGDPQTLSETLDKLIPDIPANEKVAALAVISPHAGYIYSGGVAGETFARVKIPKDIIILGPNHHGHGSPIALMDSGSWAMPMGDIDINAELAGLLRQNCPAIERDSTAHKFEHSLEVQVPFLQYLRSDIRITPLVISHIPLATCLEVGKAIAQVIRDHQHPVLIVASTDMSHYESRDSAAKKDNLALAEITDMSPEGLYDTVLGNNISMCGFIPTTIALAAANALGGQNAELVRYADSGEVSGDTQQVVGYAGVIISWFTKPRSDHQNSLANHGIDMTNIRTYNVGMINLNINQIKTHFSSCLAKVSAGETVVVCKRNIPIAEIKPLATRPRKKRPIGLAGKEYPDFKISSTFFAPLPDDIVAAFNGEESWHLLDTCTFLWLTTADTELSKNAITVFTDPMNEVWWAWKKSIVPLEMAKKKVGIPGVV